MSETGPHRHFRSLYRQSDPGSRVNEDLCGLHAGYGWIVDGATGVSGGKATPGPSDAAWLANTIGASLSRLTVAGTSIGALLAMLESVVAAAFQSLAPAVPEADPGPAACLGLLALLADSEGLCLHGAFLGDVVALVPTAGGIIRWTDERAKPFEKRTLASLDLAGRSEPGLLPEAVRLQILENRRQLNRPDGYWVVQPQRPWAGRELTFEARIKSGQPVVLATDGFMRLTDVFGAYTDADLHAALAEGRGDSLTAELRDLERRDSMAANFPRVKTHDDATVLVLEVEA